MKHDTLQQKAEHYNKTIHDLVEICPFDGICPASEYFLKEALHNMGMNYIRYFNKEHISMAWSEAESI